MRWDRGHSVCAHQKTQRKKNLKIAHSHFWLLFYTHLLQHAAQTLDGWNADRQLASFSLCPSVSVRSFFGLCVTMFIVWPGLLQTWPPQLAHHSSPAGRFSSILLMNLIRISVTLSPLRVSWTNLTSTAIWTWITSISKNQPCSLKLGQTRNAWVTAVSSPSPGLLWGHHRAGWSRRVCCGYPAAPQSRPAGCSPGWGRIHLRQGSSWSHWGWFPGTS